jgi:hypothetical protein
MRLSLSSTSGPPLFPTKDEHRSLSHFVSTGKRYTIDINGVLLDFGHSHLLSHC